jgi:YVTN family beta-propeller protein
MRRSTGTSVILALGLCLVVSLAHGQWIEDSVYVGTTQAFGLTYNSTADVVYGVGYTAFFAIDCATNQLIASTPSTRRGLDIAYDSIDNRAYCALDAEDSGVVVIDGTSHSRLHAFALGSSYSLVWDSDFDRLYVSVHDDRRVVVIDCRADTVLARIRVGEEPTYLYFNRPQHKLYVLNEGGCSVSIIDLNTLQVIRTISLGDDIPTGGWYALTAGKFYCGAYGAGQVYVIDGAGDTLRKVISLGTGNGVNDDGVGGSEAHGRVLVGTYHDTIMTIDMAQDSVVRRFSGCRGRPRSFLYSARSDRFYCGSLWDSVASILAPDGAGILHTLPVRTPVKFLAVPTHGRIYAGSVRSELVYVLRDSTTGICEPNERHELPVLAARPNPFRQTVTFSASAGANGLLRIWNAGGVLVRTLPAAGTGRWAWNGLDETGRVVAPGVYYARADAAATKLIRLP